MTTTTRDGSRGDVCGPLSFAQQRMWVLNQLLPASPAYNIRYNARCDQRLAPEAVAQALREIVRRHGVLRTRFRLTADVVEQVVPGEWTWDLPVVDLRGVSGP